MNEHLYGMRGVAFTTIGSDFSARLHWYPSVIGSKGSTCYSDAAEELVVTSIQPRPVESCRI